jgi:hypothetical protein
VGRFVSYMPPFSNMCCRLPPYSITSQNSRKHLATMIVIPPTAGEYSLTVSNPHTYEIRSVFGGTEENAGSTLVASWLDGTRQTMKVSFAAPVLAFVYTLYIKDWHDRRLEPVLQTRVLDPVKRIRELLSGWARWQDDRDKVEAPNIPRTIVFYDYGHKPVSIAARIMLLKVAWQLGLVMYEMTMTVEETGMGKPFDPETNDTHSLEFEDPEKTKVEVRFSRYHELTNSRYKSKAFFEGVGSIDARTQTAFSPDLILPTATAPRMLEDLDQPDHWQRGGAFGEVGMVRKRWERKALVLWTEKRYAKTACRLFGAGAIALLKPDGWAGAEGERKSWLEELVTTLRPTDLPGPDPHTRLKAKQKAREDLYNAAFEISGPEPSAWLPDTLHSIAENWGLPQDRGFAAKIVKEIQKRLPVAVSRLLYGHLKCCPMLVDKLRDLQVLCDGDRELIGNVVKLFLSNNPSYVIDADELESLSEYTGTDFVVKNERHVSSPIRAQMKLTGADY